MSELIHPGLEFAVRFKRSGLKQHHVAAQLNLTPSAFNEFLKGKRMLPARACAHMEALMGAGRQLWARQAEYEYQLAVQAIALSHLPLVADPSEQPLEAALVAEQPDASTLRMRMRPEAYERRVYELEMEYMLAPAGSAEGKAAWDICERVKANYARAYPDRPLRPHPAKESAPAVSTVAFGPPKQKRAYTKRAKSA